MKRLSAFALGLLFSLALAPHLSAAPQFNGGRTQNRERVCVYQDINYQGWEQCYNAGDEITTLDRRNNGISSIRIYGRARVTVYEDTNFRGHSAEFSSDVADLGRRNISGSKSWSDHIQSLRVSPDGYSGNNGSNGSIFGRDQSTTTRNNQQLNDGICVYERRDYQGREQCWNTGQDVSDLKRSGNWSDRISSIRVFGRSAAVLYRDIGFRGESIVIDRDVPDLSQVSGQSFRNWNRQISSLAIEDDRNGNGRGRGRGRGRFWR